MRTFVFNSQRTQFMKKFLFAICALVALCACEKGEYYFPSSPDGKYGEAADAGYDAPSGMPNGGGYGEGQAGLVTAGEWNDLDNWAFWGKLMTTQGGEQENGYGDTAPYWRFWTDRRVAVKVSGQDGNPAGGVIVTLRNDGTAVWAAVTDNHGRADCWVGLHQHDVQTGKLSLELNGQEVEGEPVVTTWSSEVVAFNEYTVTADAPASKADILFIVDATGSMADELEFLKEDLMDILGRAQQAQLPVSIRTGALFYRDEGDDYVTKESAFTADYGKTIDFIKQQHAEGGGDFPEAVHTALEKSLQAYDWDKSARARLAFMLLDAPPHQDHQGVVESLHKSIDKYAEMGIKLIPVASSGIDKPTEFFLRMAAIATDGTYVFITGDSGIGGEHLQASVGEYQVEKLNDLMVRLIQKYLE